MAVEPFRIATVDDPRVRDFRGMSDPAFMRERGLFVAEGRLAVERLLASRFRTCAVLLTDSLLPRLEPALAARAGDGGAPSVYLTDSAQLRQITGFRFHRGCLALGARPAAAATEAAGLQPDAARPLVALEGVSNPDNVGSIFRSAAAFGASAVLLSPTCADPLYRKAIRTSMGTSLTLPFQVAEEWPDALQQVKASGARLVALTPDPAATDLEALVRRRDRAPAALLLGNEGDGVSRAALDLCDERVRIDIEPAVDSLNVATAAAIVLQRLRAARRRRAARAPRRM